SIPFAWTGRALAVVHDLAFERHPEAYSASQRIYLQLTTRWAVSRCRVLIAVSESTRNDLESLYGANPSSIRVVPHGGGETPGGRPAWTSSLPEVGGDAVLYVDDPGDAEAFASVLQQAPADGEARASITHRAVKRAREFTWDRCAQQTADVLREALS